MLVLTRKLHETIRIGNNITISILRVKGNAVRVGIQAPRDVRVVRGELPMFDDTDEDAGTEDSTADESKAAAAEPWPEEETDVQEVDPLPAGS